MPIRRQPANPIFTSAFVDGEVDEYRRAHWTAHHLISNALLAAQEQNPTPQYEQWFQRLDPAWVQRGNITNDQFIGRRNTVIEKLTSMAEWFSNKVISYGKDDLDDGMHFAVTNKGGNGIDLKSGAFSARTLSDSNPGLPALFGRRGLILDDGKLNLARAFILIHECAHAAAQCDDNEYGRGDCEQLTRDNPDRAITNAQTYAIFALDSAEPARRTAFRPSPLGKTVTLRAVNDRFLCAAPDGTLVADREKAAWRERFVVERAGYDADAVYVALRASSGDRCYLSVKDTSFIAHDIGQIRAELNIKSKTLGKNEMFEWIETAEGCVVLKSRFTGRCVCFDAERGVPGKQFPRHVVPNSFGDEMDPWAVFRYEVVDPTTFNLRAANTKYVSANRRSDVVAAVADEADSWEQFVIEDLSPGTLPVDGVRIREATGDRRYVTEDLESGKLYLSKPTLEARGQVFLWAGPSNNIVSIRSAYSGQLVQLLHDTSNPSNDAALDTGGTSGEAGTRFELQYR